MIKVKALQDESSHWYLVPNELCAEFHELNEKIYSFDEDYSDKNAIEEEFVTKFSQYMTGGGINNVQLFIKKLSKLKNKNNFC